MKISLNYLKKFLNFELPEINELVERIGSQLGALEEGVINLSEVYKDVTIAKVVSCHPIEGSDHLNLCQIDDGAKYPDGSIRADNGHIQVVCGANNVAEGQLVAWLPPDSTIPNTHSGGKVTLTSKELAGQISHGMIASGKELGIDDDHSGILVIDLPAQPGDSFAKVYELDDYILDIENKMFTHRPDCFGLLGVAREVSGIFGKPFKSPDWYLKQPVFKPSDTKLSFRVENEIPSLVPRFSAVSMDHLSVKASPVLVKSYLSRLGVRPVNSIVDATNLAMLETGQPLHAYDYDKLKELSGGDVVITIRNPKSNDRVSLINDKTIEPPPEAIVIAANEPIGLGGIMGSSNSAISDKTTKIILESANFDMYSIRKTSMQLGIFSDAVTRFTKGQSPLQTSRVLFRATELIKEICGSDAVISSELVDNSHLPEATIKRDSLTPPVKVKPDFINSRLGADLEVEEMSRLLANVEFSLSSSSSELEVVSPFWRTDLEIREDVVEEVGRLYGYFNIKEQQLSRSVMPPKTNSELDLKDRIRRVLVSAGANEVLTYSFVPDKLLKSSDQDEKQAYRLSNALSPDVQYYRVSLIPSLLSKVKLNIKAGYSPFCLFEIGRSYTLGHPDPIESKSLALVYASKSKTKEANYYLARQYFDVLVSELHLPGVNYLSYSEVKDLPEWLIVAAKPFNTDRSALITDKEGSIVGIVGEFKSSVAQDLKLPPSCSGFEVDLTKLNSAASLKTYKKLSRFPSIKQDLTLKLPTSFRYSELSAYLLSKLTEATKESGSYNLELLGIYRPENEENFTNYTFRVTISDLNRTLKDEEVNSLLDSIASEAKDKLQAERI